jgi:hypothetical protein
MALYEGWSRRAVYGPTLTVAAFVPSTASTSAGFFFASGERATTMFFSGTLLPAGSRSHSRIRWASATAPLRHARYDQ